MALRHRLSAVLRFIGTNFLVRFKIGYRSLNLIYLTFPSGLFSNPKQGHDNSESRYFDFTENKRKSGEKQPFIQTMLHLADFGT